MRKRESISRFVRKSCCFSMCKNILVAAVPLRDVLLGALDEVTIEEAILTLQSRYEYVRDYSNMAE